MDNTEASREAGQNPLATVNRDNAPRVLPCVNRQGSRRWFLSWIGKAAIAVTAVAGGLVRFEPTASAINCYPGSTLNIPYPHCDISCIGWCSTTGESCPFGPDPEQEFFCLCSMYCIYARPVCYCENGAGFCCCQLC
jgi:hypothetical protein